MHERPTMRNNKTTWLTLLWKNNRQFRHQTPYYKSHPNLIQSSPSAYHLAFESDLHLPQNHPRTVTQQLRHQHCYQFNFIRPLPSSPPNLHRTATNTFHQHFYSHHIAAKNTLPALRRCPSIITKPPPVFRCQPKDLTIVIVHFKITTLPQNYYHNTTINSAKPDLCITNCFLPNLQLPNAYTARSFLPQKKDFSSFLPSEALCYQPII